MAELEKMKAGKDESFKGPIIGQDGKELYPAGATVPAVDLLTKRFFVKGVSGTIPD